MSGRRILLWSLALLIPAALILAVPVAWAVDEAAHDGKAKRNVTLDGIDVGGMEAAEVTAVVTDLADRYRLVEVELHGPDDTVIRLTAEDVGLAIDVDTTVAAVLEARRGGGILARFGEWIDALRAEHDVALRYDLDEAVAAATISGHPMAVDSLPSEPSYASIDGRITPVVGTNGARLDAAEIVPQLLPAAERDALPIVADFDWVAIPPLYSSSDLASALAKAENLVARPIPVSINGHQVLIAPETARRWVETDEYLEPYFAADRVKSSLEAHLGHLTEGGTDPQFEVVDGQVVVTLGEPVLACCEGTGAELADLMLRTALGIAPRPAELTPKVVDEFAPQRVADEFGIRQVVGEFTTKHRCCQGRVKNIQRIADIIHGQIIEPGGRFSINEFVGRRTRDKGFVGAGVIESGRFTTDVGGGISQFATTMFNAAFFAGLDFEKYQSHSIYISRYPYGREATLSFPNPDLVVTNPTPYHMFIATSYTDTTITVQLYSTPYYTVEQTGQDRYGVGRCTGVNTYRSRTDPAGNVIEDKVIATYRPGEGLDCNGRATPKVP